MFLGKRIRNNEVKKVLENSIVFHQKVFCSKYYIYVVRFLKKEVKSPKTSQKRVKA